MPAVRVRTSGGWQDIAIQGPQGLPGPTGSTGSTGPAGTPGEKWFSQAGAPAGATGIVGDWSLDSSTGDYYEKTGASSWTLRGNLRGPQGATGSTGSQGPTGNTGSTGSPGAAGSVWRSGAGPPAGGLGVVGDWYLNTANGDVHEKTGASAYTLRDNITGPTGLTGATGSTGPPGAAEVYEQPTQPSSTNEGAIWIDSDALIVPGEGPPGPAGADGPPGAASTVPGPTGPAGADGAPGAVSSQIIPLLPLWGTASAAASNLAVNVMNAVSDPNYRMMLDMRLMTKLRIMGRIGGALVAATKIRLQYHTGGNPNIATGDGGWTTLGDSAGSHTLNAPFWTAELTVPVGARIDNCLIRCALFSGDGAADPTITGCVVKVYA